MGGLDSHNARIDTGVDTERDCVLLCAQADTIGCKSMEYFVSGGATGTCQLSVDNYASVNPSVHIAPTNVHFFEICQFLT